MVPGSLGCGSAVLAAMTTFAPSFAARRPMARPMPREAPVMKRVFPLRLMGSTRECQGCVLQEACTAHHRFLKPLRAHRDVLGKEAAERDAAGMGGIRVAAGSLSVRRKRHFGERCTALREGEEPKIRRRAGKRFALGVGG